MLYDVYRTKLRLVLDTYALYQVDFKLLNYDSSYKPTTRPHIIVFSFSCGNMGMKFPIKIHRLVTNILEFN